MTKLIFAYPGYKKIAEDVARYAEVGMGEFAIHHFPDGETLVRIDTDIMDTDVILFCPLDHPDGKAMALMFFAETAKNLGAKSVGLMAPYLGYMRQDKRFHKGEAITSEIFAAFVSELFDHIVTVDPHLHRHQSMDEIYTIPSKVIHAADAVAEWIKKNVEKPVLIGPDEESDQWVADVANRAGAAYTVLTKIRHGDRDVEVSVPDVDQYKDYTPVLVDDIISTARTMIAAVKHINAFGMKAPVCIGVHAIFAGDAYQALQDAGAGKILSCNTIPHPSNAIDISQLLSETLMRE